MSIMHAAPARSAQRGMLRPDCHQRKPDPLKQLRRSGSPRLITHVRFGSLADMLTSPRHVRFTPNNGRWATHPWLSVYARPRCFAPSKWQQ